VCLDGREGLGSGYSQEGGGLTEITHLFPEGEGALLFAIGHLFHLLQQNANNATGKQDATQTNRGKTNNKRNTTLSGDRPTQSDEL
jgi:hypothetical protein